MVRFLIRVGISLLTAAVGLLIAGWILDDVTVSPAGFVTAVVVFAAAQAILTPFILKVSRQHAPALLGGIGLVSTFVALLLASLFSGGLRITGVTTWVLATLIVWIVTALGTWLLPIWWLKEKRNNEPA